MRKAVLTGLAAGAMLLGFPAALACDNESHSTFILKSPDGTTNLIGSVDVLKHLRHALGSERKFLLWTRVDGREYVITDPTVLAGARAIFERGDGLDTKQAELEKEISALSERQDGIEGEDAAAEREEELLDQRQEALDDEQERISDAMTRDLDALVRDAIHTGKAAQP